METVRLTNIALVCQGEISVQFLRVNQVGHELQRLVQVNPGHVKYQMIEVGVVIVRLAQLFIEIKAALVFVFDDLGCAAL